MIFKPHKNAKSTWEGAGKPFSRGALNTNGAVSFHFPYKHPVD